MERKPETVEAIALVADADFWNKVEIFTLRLDSAQTPEEADSTRQEAATVLTSHFKQYIGSTGCLGVIGDTYMDTGKGKSPKRPSLAATWGAFSEICFRRLLPDDVKSEKLIIALVDSAEPQKYITPLLKDTIVMIEGSNVEILAETPVETCTTELAIWGSFFHAILTSPEYLKMDERKQRAQVAKMQTVLTTEISSKVSEGKELFVRIDPTFAYCDEAGLLPSAKIEHFLSPKWRCIIPEYEAHDFRATDVEDYVISGGMPCVEMTDPDDETKYIVPLASIIYYGEPSQYVPDDIVEIEQGEVSEDAIYRHMTDYTDDEAIADSIYDAENNLRYTEPTQHEVINAEVNSLNDILENKVLGLPACFDGIALRQNVETGDFVEIALFYSDCTFCGFDIQYVEGQLMVVFALEVPTTCFTHKDELIDDEVETELIYVPAGEADWRKFFVYEDDSNFIVERFDIEDVVQADEHARTIIASKDYTHSSINMQMDTLDDLCDMLNESISKFIPSDDSDEEKMIQVAASMYWSIPLGIYGSVELDSFMPLAQMSGTNQGGLILKGDELDAAIPEIETGEFIKNKKLYLPISQGIPMLRLIDKENQMVYLIVTSSVQSIILLDNE